MFSSFSIALCDSPRTEQVSALRRVEMLIESACVALVNIALKHCFLGRSAFYNLTSTRGSATNETEKEGCTADAQGTGAQNVARGARGQRRGRRGRAFILLLACSVPA